MNPGKEVAMTIPLAPMSTRPLERSHTTGAQTDHQTDVELVRRILEGDETAWNYFVERYAGLILAMSRRYMRSNDIDDIRSVFVNVLESLRRVRFRTYEGRAALSTWLALVARSHVMDHLRQRFGRNPNVRALRRLTPEERSLFRFYYVEGMPRSEVVTRLEANGERWSVDRFIATLEQIERKLGERWLRRLSYDLHAQSIGASSGRLLEYLDHLRDEFGQREGAQSPEYYVMEREARATTDHLRASIAALGPRDRRMVELRFEQGWTARHIAAELGMNGQKSVYKSIERILGRLRRTINGRAQV
jgi:DNA-directed RNA polymerase specialized sigma24 family protein